MNVLKNISLALLTLLVAGVIAFAGVSKSSTVYADGSGTTDACKDTTANVAGSVEGSDDLVTYNVGSGNIVTGVCIKSGNNMFEPTKHSVMLGNGSYENGCYTVSGVGTQTATVTRNFGGNTCQGISHIDVVYAPYSNPCESCECRDTCNPCEGCECDDSCENPCEGCECDDSCEQPCVEDCENPEEPEEPTTPGEVLGTSTTAPTGGVNAGAGPAEITSLIGLSTSLGTIGFGIRRLHKND